MSHKCNDLDGGCEGGQHVTTLPASGEVVTFREPTMGEMKEFMGIMPILSAPSGDDPSDSDAPVDAAPEENEGNSWDATFQMVCALSVKPKFTDGEREQAEGEQPLDDVLFRDVVFLMNEMTDASGLKQAQTEARPT